MIVVPFFFGYLIHGHDFVKHCANSHFNGVVWEIRSMEFIISGFNELEFNYIAMVHSILHKNVIVSICLYTSVGVTAIITV